MFALTAFRLVLLLSKLIGALTDAFFIGHEDPPCLVITGRLSRDWVLPHFAWKAGSGLLELRCVKQHIVVHA
jgi:hypothetical protein